MCVCVLCAVCSDFLKTEKSVSIQTIQKKNKYLNHLSDNGIDSISSMLQKRKSNKNAASFNFNIFLSLKLLRFKKKQPV